MVSGERGGILGGMGLRMGRKRVITVVKPSNSKGSALLCTVSKVSQTADNRILFRKGSLAGLDRGRLTGVQLSRVKFVFRRVCVVGGLAVLSGVILPTTRDGGSERDERRGRRENRRLVHGVKVVRVTSGSVGRISNKRLRQTYVYEDVVGRPGLLFTSRPANTLGHASSGRIVSRLIGLGGRKAAVIVMARSTGITTGYNEILFVISNGVGKRCANLGRVASRGREREDLGG